MRIEHIREIANAVLYEGYLLYPYRQSAIKNRTRWTFGVVYPREYSEANGGLEPWTMHTECLVEATAGQPDDGSTSNQGPGRPQGSPLPYTNQAPPLPIGGATVEDVSLDITVRFLHLLLRSVEQSDPVKNDFGEPYADGWSLANRFTDEPLQEGVEREVSTLNLSLRELVAGPRIVEINFPGERLVEEKSVSLGVSRGQIVREQHLITGAVILSAEPVGSNIFKLSVSIENRTPETGGVSSQRDAVLFQSFVSTHTILQVHHGSFISLLDPPEALQPLVRDCQNLRTWPVMVGEAGERNAMLSSPIILYDYPQIAPESPGNLFDGTEIDEILSLRILTLTDEEKEQMRQDERTREILERTENLTPEQFMKLHGAIRDLRPIRKGEKA